MATVKVVSLKARPYQVSHLCFPVHGVIEGVQRYVVPARKGMPIIHRTLQLGDNVTEFDFKTFYAGLSKTSSAHASRLSYDSSGILNDAGVQASLLITLRGESIGAVLDKAINARQNAYYAKYANQSQIISVMKQLYNASTPPSAPVLSSSPTSGSPPFVSMSKPDMLAQMSYVALNQNNMLQGAYGNSNRTLVTETTSVLQTQPSTTNPLDTTQTVTNIDYGYRTPFYESAAQNLRAQISLVDQQFAQYMSSQNFNHLDQVFTNELQGIDLDIKRLQIAYLSTILMSPIGGVITGIYKNSGDWVQAGEPVIRVEDNSSVILVGTLSYQGSISIGSVATVTTSLFDSSPLTLSGSVIAVRGHASNDDLWDVHVLCGNVTAPVLPINYHFDYDDTSVTIT